MTPPPRRAARTRPLAGCKRKLMGRATGCRQCSPTQPSSSQDWWGTLTTAWAVKEEKKEFLNLLETYVISPTFIGNWPKSSTITLWQELSKHLNLLDCAGPSAKYSLVSPYLGGFICTSPSWFSVTRSSCQFCWTRMASQMIECYHFAEPQKR